MTLEPGLHVVLGGGGGIGSAVARLLAEEPVALRVVTRSNQALSLPSRVPVAAADAIWLDTLRRACEGARVIYHCLHPTRDIGLLGPITRHVIQVAAETGALLVAASCADVYGPADGPLDEDSPQRPVGTVARAHARAAAAVAEAHASGRIHAVIGRAGHVYGPRVRTIWPGADVGAVLRGTPVTAIGDVDALHSFVYVDDFARALIALGATPNAWGRVWHTPGAPPLSVRDFITLVGDAAHVEPQLRVRGRAALLLRALVIQKADALRQLRPLFERPFVVDHRRFDAAFQFQPTPHGRAVAQTVAWRRQIDEGQRAEAEKALR